MNEIEYCYKFMIENFPQFQVFIEEHKKYSTDELIQKYKINLDHDKNMV